MFGRKHQRFVIDKRRVEQAAEEAQSGETQAEAPPPPPRPAPQAPLRVALDVRFWGMSGLGTYVRELLGGFARGGLPVRWTLIGNDDVLAELPEGLELERFITFNAPIYSASALLRYPSLRGIDVFHYPHYNLPLTRARKKVATVHDLFHLRYGNMLRRRYQKFFLTRLRWSRAHLLAISGKTRREVIQAGRIAPDRITVIPEGPGRRPMRNRPAAPELMSLANTPIRAPWMLAVGIDQPHKNFDFLLAALGLYYQRRPDAPPLVWMGLSGESRVRRTKQIAANMRQKVALETYGGNDQVEALFAGAGALLFPSLDEGFGLPPLEAMVRGVPVVCSRCEPMLSVLGGAPLYFEPTESASLWRMLDRLLDSRAIWEDVAQRGRQQAARYNWEATARATYGLYEKVAGRE